MTSDHTYFICNSSLFQIAIQDCFGDCDVSALAASAYVFRLCGVMSVVDFVGDGVRFAKSGASMQAWYNFLMYSFVEGCVVWESAIIDGMNFAKNRHSWSGSCTECGYFGHAYHSKSSKTRRSPNTRFSKAQPFAYTVELLACAI